MKKHYFIMFILLFLVNSVSIVFADYNYAYNTITETNTYSDEYTQAVPRDYMNTSMIDISNQHVLYQFPAEFSGTINVVGAELYCAPATTFTTHFVFFKRVTDETHVYTNDYYEHASDTCYYTQQSQLTYFNFTFTTPISIDLSQTYMNRVVIILSWSSGKTIYMGNYETNSYATTNAKKINIGGGTPTSFTYYTPSSQNLCIRLRVQSETQYANEFLKPFAINHVHDFDNEPIGAPSSRTFMNSSVSTSVSMMRNYSTPFRFIGNGSVNVFDCLDIDNSEIIEPFSISSVAYNSYNLTYTFSHTFNDTYISVASFAFLCSFVNMSEVYFYERFYEGIGYLDVTDFNITIVVVNVYVNTYRLDYNLDNYAFILNLFSFIVVFVLTYIEKKKEEMSINKFLIYFVVNSIVFFTTFDEILYFTSIIVGVGLVLIASRKS